MRDLQIRNPVVCDASKVSLYKKDNHNMPTSERRVHNQIDHHANKHSPGNYQSHIHSQKSPQID